MTKTKLAPPLDRTVSSFQKDVNRLKKVISGLSKANNDKNILINNYIKLTDMLLNEKRVTKSELSKYFKKKGVSIK